MIAATEAKQLSNSLQFSFRCEGCHKDVTVMTGVSYV